MASPISMKICKPCQEENKETKARALCFECHELLCEDCASKHLKNNQDHNLIDLVPFFTKSTSEKNTKTTSQLTSTPNDESELSSDFLDHVTLTEYTVLYRGAQVAVGSLRTRASSNSVDPSNLIANCKCFQFSAKLSDDKEKVWVRGVLCIRNTVIILDHNNRALKVFDTKGQYLSSIKIKEMTWGMNRLHDSTFATCGFGTKVYLWSVQGQAVVSEEGTYDVDHDTYSICCNSVYCCILHSVHSAVTVLDTQGNKVRKIIMKEAIGKKFNLGYDFKMDNQTSNMFVPCWNEDGVLCITIEGDALWFTPLIASQGIDEIRGTLCVAECNHACLHLLTKEGKYVRKLLEKPDLEGLPKFVHMGQEDKLYVSYVPYDDRHDTISVYNV